MTRRSVVSGLFYPESAGQFAAAMAGFGGVRDATGGFESDDNAVFGVVVPHASMDCCGKVASALWRGVSVPDHVIVLGPNHTGLGAVAAVARNSTFSTPSGEIAMDTAIADAIVDGCPLLEFDDVAHEEEHSIEAVLPYIRELNPAVRLTAICVRSMSYADCVSIASVVAGVVRAEMDAGGRVLIVASSDLNHNEPLRIGMRKDRMVLDRIEGLDAPGLYQAVVEHHISMCGMVPVVIMMLAAREAGAGYAELVEYATSMDYTGDPSSVVGYGSVVLRSKCPADKIRHLDRGIGFGGT